MELSGVNFKLHIGRYPYKITNYAGKNKDKAPNLRMLLTKRYASLTAPHKYVYAIRKIDMELLLLRPSVCLS